MYIWNNIMREKKTYVITNLTKILNKEKEFENEMRET